MLQFLATFEILLLGLSTTRKHYKSFSCNFLGSTYLFSYLYPTNRPMTRDVTEPANIRIRRKRISCAKSVGFGCGCGFVVRSKLPAYCIFNLVT